MVQLTISSIEFNQGPINIESWLQQLVAKYPLENLALLRQAATLAQVAGEEAAAPNGESCLHQGLAMAEILAHLEADEETLAAAIVYSSVCFADLSLEDVIEHLSPKIAKLVKGTQQMQAINILRGENYHSHDPATIDNIRKMLLAMVDDVSVVLIKLAERLCILRNVAIFSENKKRQVAQETMDIYAPLANRLGIGQIKWQLEDLSFRYLNPTEYKNISSGLKEKRIEREHYIKQIIAELKQLLTQADVHDYKISGRAKHIYSIYRKMQRKRVPLSEIYDASAVRILVPSIADCYTALSNVHTNWRHISKEFDDYVATPKPNGYRSIHTAVVGPEGKNIEIQIRTYEMHEESELGVAAHWMYKEGRRKISSYEEKIAWLRQVMDWQKEVAKSDAAKQEIQTELFDDRVYIFTPNGDVLDLPKGATPLDFAYQVHSELGHRTRGAKINGHIIPLTYELKTGEQVEILTIKHGHPSRDWLNPHLGYLKTSRAKAKVLQWFKKQDFDKNFAEGQALLEKEQRRMGIKEINIEKLARDLNYKTANDLLAALGRGDVRVSTLINMVQPQIETEVKTETHRIKPQESLTDIDIQGVGNLLTHMALCCKPVPGDAIVGYVTIGRGISIHREDCSNIQQRQREHDERIISVNWGSKTQQNYAVDLVVSANDRPGLIRDVTILLANENISIIRMNTVTNRDENTAHITLTIEIGSLAPLSKILARISQLNDVYDVRRAS